MSGRPVGFVVVGVLLGTTLVGCSGGDAPGAAAASTVTVTTSVPGPVSVTVTATPTTPTTPAGAWTAATVSSTPPSPTAATRRTTKTAAPAATRRAPSVDSRAAPPPATRAPAAPAPARTTTGRAAGGVRVPNLVGNSLTAAFAMLSDLGVPRDRRSPHDSSGKTRTVLNPDNWQVCNQKPAAGSTATAQTVYQLGVVKYGERC